MATGYRMINTTVSGSALLSGLDGDDVRALEFEAANKQLPALVVDDAQIEIEATHWVQASIGSLLLEVDFSTSPSLSLGPDNATGASLYQQLFNMRAEGDTRLLRFCLTSGSTGSGTLDLENTSATSNYVLVRADGGVDSDSRVLYNSAAEAGATGFAGDLPGLERIVIVKAVDVTPGAEIVEFDILSGSV